MPTHDYRKLRLLRELRDAGRESGLPTSTLDVPFTLWRSRGRSTLIHASEKQCLVSRRKLVSPVTWTGTLDEALADPLLCDCARSAGSFGAAGMWLRTFDQLQQARSLFDRLRADPEPVRFALLCRTEVRAAHAAREQARGVDELAGTVARLAAELDEFNATVAADWRSRADDPASWVWYVAGQRRYFHHPFATFVREHGTMREWVARGHDEVVTAAEWSRLCDAVGDVTPRPWLYERVPVGDVLHAALRQCDAVDVLRHNARMVAGLLPDVVAERLRSPVGNTRVHRLPDGVDMTGFRLSLELFDDDPVLGRRADVDAIGELALAVSATAEAAC